MSETRNIHFGRPWITDDDRHAVAKVLDGPILTHGPRCKDFEAEFAAFLGSEAKAVTMSSCMAALHMSYFALGIGAGDEVIVPAQTHTATAHAVELVGAKPIFVDADPATGNLTAEAIERALTPRVKAISVVHFLGIPCGMPAIMKLAEARGLKVIEDCALAVGSRYDGRHVGLFGDAGCFSFYPVKHITTGEGGMFVTKHPALAEAVARKRGFGVDRTHAERQIPGMYEVPQLGLNYRMSEMQAALGRSQTRRIPEILRLRRANFEALKKALEGHGGLRVLDAVDPKAANSWYCLSLVLEGALGERRNDFVGRLNAAGVGTSVYYPAPVPRMRYYADKYGYDAGRFPRASHLSDHSVALPVGPHVSPEDVDYVGRTVLRTLKEMNA